MGAASYIDAGRSARKKHYATASASARPMLIVGGVGAGISEWLRVPGIAAAPAMSRDGQSGQRAVQRRDNYGTSGSASAAAVFVGIVKGVGAIGRYSSRALHESRSDDDYAAACASTASQRNAIVVVSGSRTTTAADHDSTCRALGKGRAAESSSYQEGEP